MLKFTVHTNLGEELAHKLAKASTKAEHAVAVKAMKDTSPFVPFLTGSLDQRTRVDGNIIIYPGPYARYLYYGKVMVYEGPPAKIVTPEGKTVLTHFGQRKVPIERPLNIRKRSGHGQAQSHWFEASKAQNLQRWLRKAQEALKDEL